MENIKPVTVDEMEQALKDINFFIGGLSIEAIQFYYKKLVSEGKIKPVSSEFEFQDLKNGLRLLVEVNYRTGSYTVMIYFNNEHFLFQNVIGTEDIEFDLALLNLYKSAIEFAKGELSK